MIKPLTQEQIDDLVRRAADTVRQGAPDPSFVFELPGTPTQAEMATRIDGWFDIGAVVDVTAGRSYLVWWNPRMRYSRGGSEWPD